MTCRLRWCVEMETRCRIPIWRTFGQIQWHVIPETRITLQGAATWWIHCHDSRATCHIAGVVTWRNQCHDRATLQGVRIPFAILKIAFRHIYFFLFIMQFRLRLWRAAAFVSSPIQLLKLAALTVVLQSNSFILSDERLMTNCCVVPARWTESCHDYLPRSFTEIRSVFRWSE